MKSAYVFGAAVALGSVSALLERADAATVPATAAAFTFETSGLLVSSSSSGSSLGPLLAESGSGSFSIVHIDGQIGNYTSPTGNGSAHSIASDNWGGGDAYLFNVSTANVSDIVISFDQTANSNGPAVFNLGARWDPSSYFTIYAGNQYTVVTTTGFNGSRNPTFHYSFDLSGSTKLNDAPNALFRLQNQDQGAASSGLSFIDNVVITGDSPAPVSASGTWIHPTSGNWEDSSNWSNSVVASGAGTTATFANAIGSGSATVTLTVNETVGMVAFTGTSGGSYTIAGNGTTLNLDNGNSAASASVAAGTQKISAPILLTNGLNITTAVGSSLTLAGAVTGAGSLTVTANSSLVVSPTGVISVPLVSAGNTLLAAQVSGSLISARTVPSLNVSSGGVITVGATTAGVARQLLTTGSVGLAGVTGNWTGKIDLNNNDLVVQAGPNTSLATITDQISRGFNGGAWNGAGGIISSSAASNLSHLTALGTIQNNQGGQPLFTASHQFDATTPGAGDVLVKYTYYGDANLDGKVDGSDYSRIDTAFLSSVQPTGWYNGDFNYDGVINGSDYTLIDNAFNTQGAALTSSIASPLANTTSQIAGPIAVPEPTLLSVFGLGSVGLLARRKRK